MVDRIHRELALKVELWCAPYWMGENSQKLKEMGDPRIVKETGERVLYICPRHPAVKRHVAETVGRLVQDYHLDGLWIDFMDGMPYECHNPHEHTDQSLGKAFTDGIRAMYKAVTAANPDAIIEYRITHANINNKPFAHVWETSDTPFEFDLNRRLGVMTRAFGEGMVIKTDPCRWERDESNENVGKYMATMVIRGVPTLGVDLRTLSQSHRRVIKAWLDFYHQHKKALHAGEFEPLGFDVTFPILKVEAKDQCFLYIGSASMPPVLLKGNPEVYTF